MREPTVGKEQEQGVGGLKARRVRPQLQWLHGYKNKQGGATALGNRQGGWTPSAAAGTCERHTAVREGRCDLVR